MRKRLRLFIFALFSVFLWSTCFAQVSMQENLRLNQENCDKVPPLVQATFPTGAKIVSHDYVADYLNDTEVNVAYSATRDNPHITTSPTQYRLECRIVDPGKPLIKMQIKQLKYFDQKTKDAVASWLNVQDLTRGGHTLTATEQDYPWGKCVVQKEVDNVQRDKPEIIYNVYAIGNVGNAYFEAHIVSMLDDKSRADEWLGMMIPKMKNWTISNVRL